MPKLMQLTNGQFLLTLPKEAVRALQAKKGDKIQLNYNLKKGVVELEKVG